MFSSLRLCTRPLSSSLRRRALHANATSPLFESKYAEKLQRRAEEQGLSIADLKAKIKEQQETERQERRRKLDEELASQKAAQAQTSASVNPLSPQAPSSGIQQERKDSSPIKPLSTILNLQKLLSTPHTSEQITSLWTAYHASRSGGTGRGFVCASVPLDLYKKMAQVGAKYPSFVVPVRRPKSPDTPKGSGNDGENAYEFYFLQWAFHPAPPIPSANADPFTAQPMDASSSSSNPAISTILFTPLQEYKLRQSFATPYLVATNYTDLAGTHGLVLLRGELTPSGSISGNYMLTQEDAQMLLMALQRFYLWGYADGSQGEDEPKRLLKVFHEEPEQFKWEDLLKVADWTPAPSSS